MRLWNLRAILENIFYCYRYLSFRDLIQKNQQEAATQLFSIASPSTGEIALLNRTPLIGPLNVRQVKPQMHIEKPCDDFLHVYFGKKVIKVFQ